MLPVPGTPLLTPRHAHKQLQQATLSIPVATTAVVTHGLYEAVKLVGHTHQQRNNQRNMLYIRPLVGYQSPDTLPRYTLHNPRFLLSPLHSQPSNWNVNGCPTYSQWWSWWSWWWCGSSPRHRCIGGHVGLAYQACNNCKHEVVIRVYSCCAVFTLAHRDCRLCRWQVN